MESLYSRFCIYIYIGSNTWGGGMEGVAIALVSWWKFLAIWYMETVDTYITTHLMYTAVKDPHHVQYFVHKIFVQ